MVGWVGDGPEPEEKEDAAEEAGLEVEAEEAVPGAEGCVPGTEGSVPDGDASVSVCPGPVVPFGEVVFVAPPVVVRAPLSPVSEEGFRPDPFEASDQPDDSDCPATGRRENHFPGNPFSSATVTQETATVRAMSRDTALRIARFRWASSTL